MKADKIAMDCTLGTAGGVTEYITSLRINKTSLILLHQCTTDIGARLWVLDSGVFITV